MRKTIQSILDKKTKGKKITMLTAYDYPMARIVDEALVDIVLVGDSVANVELGLESTTEVGMTEMIHHAKAVNRGVKQALLVGDMPFEAYQKDISQAVSNAQRFIDEAGCDAIKLEWFDNCLEVAKNIVDAGVAVMGHVGLTPQTAEKLGGFKVQGRDEGTAKEILDHAKALESVGCFAIVLECIPDRLAEKITKELKVPTIGIGAGVHCDGQVLVTHDLLGLFDRFRPKFAKQYIDLSKHAKEAIKQYCTDVEGSVFPDQTHSYSISDEEFSKIENL